MSHHQLDPLWTQHLGHCCTRACFNRRNDMLGIGEPYGQMRSQHLFLMHDEQLQAKEEPARRPAHQVNSVSGGDIEGAPKGVLSIYLSVRIRFESQVICTDRLQQPEPGPWDIRGSALFWHLLTRLAFASTY